MSKKHPLHDDYYDQVLKEVGEEVYYNQSGNDYDRHRNIINNQRILNKKLNLLFVIVKSLQEERQVLKHQVAVQLLIKDPTPIGAIGLQRLWHLEKVWQQAEMIVQDVSEMSNLDDCSKEGSNKVLK